jgi:hypothetical protein
MKLKIDCAASSGGQGKLTGHKILFVSAWGSTVDLCALSLYVTSPLLYQLQRFNKSPIKTKMLLWIRLLSGVLFLNKHNPAWFKKMDSISYVCISWTIRGMWIIYITFERGGLKFSNTTARALASRTAVQQRQLRAKWLLCSTRVFACAA